MKKTLLGLGLTVCLLVAGAKIYSFYQAHQPPFQVGECFLVSDPDVGEVKFQVLENNKSEASTIAEGTINNFMGLPGVQVKIPVKVSFQEIRDSKAQKSSCE